MVTRTLGRLLAIATAAAALLLGPAALTATAATAMPLAAAASAPVSAAVQMAPPICSNPSFTDADKRSAGCYDDHITANDNYLPVQRWSQAASGLHLRTGDGIVSDLTTRLQREATFPTWMASGNALWSWSTAMTKSAISLDLMKSVGLQIDQIAAQLGSAIANSGVLGAIVGIGLIVVLWRAARGRSNPWGYIGRVAVVLGVMTAMSIGAQSSTVAGGDYRPGVMSPGWIATKTNSIVSSLASAPALAISSNMTQYTGAQKPTTGATNSGILTCDAYTAELAAQFADSAGGGNALANKVEASVPMVISRMWEQTGLEVWKTAQFGTANDYGDYMYCRLLEERADTPALVQMMLTMSAATRAGASIPSSVTPNMNAAPWGTGGDVESRDRSLIAWGACRLDASGNWSVTGDWSQVTRSGGRSAPTADDCSKWWSEDFYTDAGPSGWISGDTNNLEFSGKSSDTRNDTRSAPEARDFLLSLHAGGANAGGSTVMVVLYTISSFIVFLVMAVLAGAVIVAKVVAVVIVMSIMLVLIKDLLPGQEGNLASVKLAKVFVGIAFAVFGLMLLFSFVTVLTGFLVSAAAGWFGGSSFMAILWTGAAPLAALVAVHVLFTKVLKMPSPLTINGARAWGDRIGEGSVGSSAMNAVGRRASGLTRAAGAAGRTAAQNAGRTVASRATGGRFGSGAPVRRAGAGVGTAATSAAAGAAAGAAVAGARAGRMRPGDTTRAGRASAADPKSAALGGGSTVAPLPKASAKGSAERVGSSKGSDAPKVTDGAQTEKPELTRRQQRVADREQVLADATERRGYGTTRATRVAGDAREALSARMAEVRRQFAEKPLRSSMRTVGGAAGVAAATVLTGGAALPVIAAVSTVSQTHKAREARRGAIAEHERRREVEREARQEAERKAKQRSEEAAAKSAGTPAPLVSSSPERPPVRRASTRTNVERKPTPKVAGARPAARRIAAGATPAAAARTTRTAQPRSAAPTASARPRVGRTTGGDS